MNFLFLTKSSGAIIGPIANILGYIFEWIFNGLSAIGVANVGWSIIVFTIIINIILLPTTIKQQKATRLNSVIMPEIQAIQDKYKGKSDQESMMRMQQEQKAVYQRYGTSMTSGCLPLFIQLPVLYGLYRVIYNVPAYVGTIKNVYMQIVEPLQAAYGNYATSEILTKAAEAARIKGDLSLPNTVIDVLYTFKDADWANFTAAFPKIADAVSNNLETLNHMNNFLTINLRQIPTFTSISILIPILAGLSQWASAKLMSVGTDENNSAGQTMKMMNTMFPLMSVFFCFSMPACVGLYWVASSVVRTVIQFFLNKHFEKIDLDELVKKNMEKVNAKRAKKGLPPYQISKTATTTVRNIKAAQAVTDEERKAKKDAYEAKVKKSTDYYTSGQAKPGSLAAKAGMVQQYNERNEKK